MVEASLQRSRLPLLVIMGAVFILLLLVLIEAVILVMPRGVVEELGATLSVVEGRVFVQSGGEGDWIQVAEQGVVQSGDRVRVAGASRAWLSFLEDTATELRPFTEVTVAELELVEGEPVVITLALELGEMWNTIAALPAGSVHEVTTAAARMTGHGCEYGVAANEAGMTWLTGHEGEVQVAAAGQTVTLGPAQRLMVEPGWGPMPYQAQAVAFPLVVVEPPMRAVDSIDLPTFLNEPLPTSTPTSTREATPTATSTAAPTATATGASCPTLSINAPHTAPPRGLFGMEWDAVGAPIPDGWEFSLEFSLDPSPGATWQRAQPDRIYQEGGHWKAELHGPGAGHWYWRVCLLAEPGAPSECCGEPRLIMHQRDEEPEPPEEPTEPEPKPEPEPEPTEEPYEPDPPYIY